MHQIILRPATSEDAAFALHVTEACMRVYAEQTWGTWNGRADLDPSFDKIIQLAGTDIGLIGVARHSDHWFLEKLYLLPAYQNRRLGSCLLQRKRQAWRKCRCALRSWRSIPHVAFMSDMASF